MRTLIVVAACASLLALSGVSDAAQIASPSIFGSIEQFKAECSVVERGKHRSAGDGQDLRRFRISVRDVEL